MTRYCTLLLCLLGLPLLFGAYPLLSLWVGHQYAIRSALYLEILVIGNLFGSLPVRMSWLSWPPECSIWRPSPP